MNIKNTRSFATISLGCKVNQYETDAMEQLLVKAGYQLVTPQEAADIYVINTCSVTNIADRKSRQMLHRVRKQNPDAIVIAAGCYVQDAAEELEKDEQVDIVIGNNKKKEIVEILEKYYQDNDTRFVIDISREQEYEEMSTTAIGEHTRAYLKIQDGCNQFCSYCIIPYTRGRIRSRKPEHVLEEVEELVKAGYREVVLTGIHLSSYGKELEQISLLDIIRMIHENPGIQRIRLGSLEPRIITEEFVKELVSLPKVCPHFHLSLQSGCDETLKRMNRHYSTKEYKEACSILRRHYDRPALTTDVIVGFAGETEEEFEQTRVFLEHLNLYEMHVFKFSVRKGTKAEKMENQNPEFVKTARSNILLDMTKRQRLAYWQSFLGKRKEVLIERKQEIDGVMYYCGHTENYLPVAVLTKQDCINEMIPVIIQEIHNHNTLIGIC
ncbi:MAG: tRNA (N(6)-L-threonylcarbamoyladenosine(37)-C(2))-methylthiotransferase MtaB [Lachnospiraceae bacterium]